MLLHGVAALAGSGLQPRVTIIGTGPAGLTLALRLQERRIPCLLIEAGDYSPSTRAQDAFRGTVEGDHYFRLEAARLCMFGGTSLHWTGWCRSLDEIDFRPRPRVPMTGWPIGKQDLDPYQRATAALLQVPLDCNDQPLSPQLDEIEMRYSPPLRFGTAFRQSIEGSATIGLLLNTTVRELVPGNERIEALTVVEANDGEHRLPVQIVCLCTGGIENSRLLLWSNERHQGGAVPASATLGRYWMEHPSLIVGDALLFERSAAQFRPTRFFAPSAAAVGERATGGAQIWLAPYRPSGSRYGALLRDLSCAAPELFAAAVHGSGRELRCGSAVHMEWEQMPQIDNRVSLDRHELDAFGVPRVRLHWRKTAVDRRTALVAERLFGEWMAQADVGRVRINHWLLEDGPFPIKQQQGAGYHHMGGTRMADNAASGVVDRNCKVFGVGNLYVGGSSVFATCGHANPTFTIVQLAMRLSDHLADLLRA